MKLRLVTIIFLGLMSIGVHAEGKSAFINPAMVMEKAPQAKTAAQTLQNEFKDRESKLRGMVDEIKLMEKNYNNDSAIMSDDQRKKAEDKIVQKKRQFQFDQQALKEDIQKRRNELIKEVQKTISAVIREYGSKNGYDFIFTEGVAYASDTVNITDDILKELAK